MTDHLPPMQALTQIGSTGDAAAIIRDLAHAAAVKAQEPIDLFDSGELVGHAFVVPEGMHVQTIDLRDQLERPIRKVAQSTHYTAGSLGAYVQAHRNDPQTALYADVRGQRIVSILDGHSQHTYEDGELTVQDVNAGWGVHRATLIVRRTPEWEHWRNRDGAFMAQETFAEHLIDGLAEIRQPAAAEMLEVAESFRATTSVEFESASRLDSGQRRLTYAETVAARAGQKGQLDIPAEFTLAVAPFEGSPPYSVTALFRYRISGGKLSLGYKLVRPDDVELHAFTDIVAGVETITGLTAYRGPAPA